MKDAMTRISGTKISAVGGAVAAMLAMGGCITVKAPDKPIEITLNVNIRQEVVVSLRKDVQNLDQQFPGVF